MEEEQAQETEELQDTDELEAVQQEELQEEPEEEGAPEVIDEGDRLQGQVKWYNRAKGYGFIEGDDEDYFVHYSQLPEGTIVEEGDEVSFDAVETEKGWQAQNVELQ